MFCVKHITYFMKTYGQFRHAVRASGRVVIIFLPFFSVPLFHRGGDGVIDSLLAVRVLQSR